MMNISFFDKVTNIFEFMFSSYLGIELFIFVLLFLSFLIINIFVKSRIAKIVSIILLLLPLVILFFIDSYFIISSIENFIMLVMQVIYYPSIVVYFFIVSFVFIWMSYTIISRSMTKFKKISNYIVLLFMFFCYFSFFSICYLEGISIFEKVDIYNNEILVSFIQIGNIVLMCYLLFNFFYYLFKFFKRYDKKIED